MADIITNAKATLASYTMGKPSIVELAGYLQPFPYGREGMKSMAARIAEDIDPSTTIKDSQPYGEIWLGSTHANGPSKILTSSLVSNKTSLRDLIASDPSYYLGASLLGNQNMQEMYKNDLPFLFKILSFDKALPLQAHPDPKLGEKLRKSEKRQYAGVYNSDFVDDNGKPEVSVALSDFTAFVGFRPPEHIKAFFDAVPAFASLFTQQQKDAISSTATSHMVSATKDALKSLFNTAIHLSQVQIKQVVDAINHKLETGGPAQAFGTIDDSQALARVWSRNAEVYGESDVGLIVTTFLMNLIQLKPGEGCWILADDIHAYVEGDVIECMANSDNMVCHGLGDTDQGGISTFVDMLSYRHLPAQGLELSYEDSWSRGAYGNSRLYKVPIEEFDLVKVTLDAHQKSRETLTLPGPLTFVVLSGTVKAKVDGEELLLGKSHIAFVRANATLELELVEGNVGEIWGSFYQEKDWV